MKHLLRSALVVMAVALPRTASGQPELAATPPQPLALPDPVGAPNADEWGAFAPGRGFKVAKTSWGELNISAYILIRYLNQLPADQTFTDHLGRQRTVNTRNDIQLHREMVFLTGFVYSPRLRYTSLLWTVNSTNQVAIAGNLTYVFADAFQLSGGIGGLPGTYSLTGVFPYFFGTDRVMADDFFRPGFTGGVWVSGAPLPMVRYLVMVGDNLSIIGIPATKLTRDLATSAAVWIMPTTGEFGPRGGIDDYEHHPHLATRFGVAYTHSREDRFNEATITFPDNTQIRLSDGVLLFETGALAPGVTVQRANYDMSSFSAGMKLRGFALHAEYYLRWLTHFSADGPVPINTIFDHGFYAQAGYSFRARVAVYSFSSIVFGNFRTDYEVGGGLNFYPAETRNWRINLHGLYVRHAAYGSAFGYYAAGQTGPIASVACDLFF